VRDAGDPGTEVEKEGKADDKGADERYGGMVEWLVLEAILRVSG